MNLGRLMHCGLTSFKRNVRTFFASRLLQTRSTRACVAANQKSGGLPDQEQEQRRMHGSRRTLFVDSATPSSAETATSTRELINIHKQSLEDAGVNLSPLAIQKNRLESVRVSLQRGTRGEARAAVNREFRLAERRLYSSQWRTRGKEEDGLEGDEGKREEVKERERAVKEMPAVRANTRAKGGGQSQTVQEHASRQAAKYVAAHQARKRQQQQQQQQQQRQQRQQGQGQRQRQPMGGAPGAAARRNDGDDLEDDDQDNSDEDDEGEFEGEETFSLGDRVRDLRVELGAQAGSRPSSPGRATSPSHAPATDVRNGLALGGPRLSHNLPPKLNLRLMETVLSGAKAAPIPEIPLGSPGLTNGVFNTMLMAWRSHEIVKLRIRDKRKIAKKYLPYIRQVCDAVEARSGGVVVWRSGRSIWVYRGEHYKPVDPKRLAEELLGKVEIPVYSPLLTALQPLLGREVTMPGQGNTCYLTRGSPQLVGSDPAGIPAPPAGLGVIFLHDAFGTGSPDTQESCKQVCDLLASLVGPGTPVLMPDLSNGGKDSWRGPLWPPGKPTFERLSGWMSKEGRGNSAAVVPYIEAAVSYMRGPEVAASKLVLVGTGWGGWVALNMLAADATWLRIAEEAKEAKEAKGAKETKETKGAKEAKAAVSSGATTSAAAAAPPLPSAPPAESAKLKAIPSSNPGAGPSPSMIISQAALRLLEACERELPATAGPLERGLWMLYGPEAKAYRQAKSLARYGGRRPQQIPPDVYEGGGLLFSAGVVGSAGHFFGDDERMALAVSVPLCFVSSKWDPMEKFQLYMTAPLVDKCAFKRFGKIQPGFWGKMAEWSDPVQATQATQAAQLAGWFIRWHLAGDSTARERVRRFCMVGKSGVGEKQTTNLGFPWLEQVTLFKGREKQLARQESEQRKKAGLKEPVNKKEREKLARQAAKKDVSDTAARRKREEGQREERPRQGPSRPRGPEGAGRRYRDFDSDRGRGGRNGGGGEGRWSGRAGAAAAARDNGWVRDWDYGPDGENDALARRPQGRAGASSQSPPRREQSSSWGGRRQHPERR